MPTLPQPVAPRNIARAKRIAKQLHALYPNSTLASCQATTAHLFGFKDWHAIEEGCKASGKSEPGHLDDELSDEAFIARRKTQAEILCVELSNVDPNAIYGRPTSRVNTDPLGIQIERLELANKRWCQTFSQVVIDELEPTAEGSDPTEYPGFASYFHVDFVEKLPMLIGDWWLTNIPNQPEVGACLKQFKLNPNRCTSLLNFGNYWGTLCMHYAGSINWTMAIGVAFILADRYGSISVQQTTEFYELAERSAGLSQEDFERELPVFFRLAHGAQLEFFACYPRDDFAAVFNAQPSSFMSNADDCKSILLTPGSKRGTWADDSQ